MSATITTPALENVQDQVSVRVDDLIVGRPLSAPVYDSHGVLLLAAGKFITADFKRILRQRGEGTIRTTAEGANLLRLNMDVAIQFQRVGLDEEIASRVDQLVGSGLMSVKNQGPAVKERIVYHGRKAYNQERREALVGQRQAASESLGSLFKEALQGKSINSTAVTQMAAEYLSSLGDDTDCTLTIALEASREQSLADHSLKMSTLGMALGIEMNLDEENCKRICIAGLIHDWGMGAVDAELRNADYLLTEHEMFQVRKHPIYTVEMLERMPGIPSVVPLIAYQVHERPNGFGYPRGIAGERIHLFARILAVADAYSALTSQRPHRPALMPYAAMECVVRMARTKDLDPDIVRALLRVLTLFPIGSFVVLNDGSLARVIRRNGNLYTKPIVQVLQDSSGTAVPQGRDEAIIDLSQRTDISIVQALPTPGSNESSHMDDFLVLNRPRL